MGSSPTSNRTFFWRTFAGLTHGQYDWRGQEPQLPSQSSVAA